MTHSLYLATLASGLTLEVAGCGQNGAMVLRLCLPGRNHFHEFAMRPLETKGLIRGLEQAAHCAFGVKDSEE